MYELFTFWFVEFYHKNTPCPTSTLDPPIEKKEEFRAYQNINNEKCNSFLSFSMTRSTLIS